jgi:FKBP-type peptidyl-prolyl cis-trans isomerase 2
VELILLEGITDIPWRFPMHDIIDSKSLAILHVSLRWESDFASHVETFYVPMNVWREIDLFPDSLAQALAGQRAGFVFKTSFAAGSLITAHDKSEVRWFPQESFAQGRRIPRLGRFYPRGLLPGHAQKPQPFRCTAVSDGRFSADFNHPLAKQPLELEITVAEVQKKRSDTGGVCHDWLQIICDGPGMQVRQLRTSTDFFADDPYVRPDAQNDAHFYENLDW